MNKRIQELKAQCYISIVDRTGDTEYDMEKFARLIAAECAKICFDEDYTSGSGYAQEITKRFGVAE
jgi:hypothetical protein